jgi:hypothetical protein
MAIAVNSVPFTSVPNGTMVLEYHGTSGTIGTRIRTMILHVHHNGTPWTMVPYWYHFGTILVPYFFFGTRVRTMVRDNVIFVHV